MAKPPSSGGGGGCRGPPHHHRTRLLLLLLLAVAACASTAGFLLRGATLDPCDVDARGGSGSAAAAVATARTGAFAGSPLEFMRSKLVLLVSHELSLSGGPLLLMELAFLLRQVGSQVVWITNQRSEETNDVTYSLEHKMLSHGVQGVQLIEQKKLKVPTMHAVVVGSDINAQTKFETQLRDFVVNNGIQDRVHFVNKTLAVAPYLAATDVLVQNSQFSGPWRMLWKDND
uniref:Glycosyl transferase family 1 domain-containing protein n=1 Tax=Oryza meridionalis TaxID=40149 RepID=A0A0E0C0A5_9ORYZ